MRSVLVMSVVVLVFASAAVATAADLTRVPTIKKIECDLNKSDPPQLTVKVEGQVNSSGWTNVQLSRRYYIVPPADGIWEYDMLAEAPTGMVLWVMTDVDAADTWAPFPAADVKGVRIYGAGGGVMEATLPDCMAKSVAKPLAAPARFGGAGEGEICGGLLGILCADGLWCDPEAGYCGGADIQGVCVKEPEVCTQQYQPVCGCDKKTYGNDCERRRAKAAKHRDGECVK